MKRPLGEARALEVVARDYKARGYKVLLEPSHEDLPAWLAPVRPDLVALKQADRVVIEVRSIASLRSSDQVELLAELVAGHPDWRFELVKVRAHRKRTDRLPADVLPPGYVVEYLAAVGSMRAEGALQPAFLLAWTAFEAAFRNALTRDGINARRLPLASALKTLLSLGYLSGPEHVDQLRRQANIRNELAHGRLPRQPIAEADIEQLVRLTVRLLDISEEGGQSLAPK